MSTRASVGATRAISARHLLHRRALADQGRAAPSSACSARFSARVRLSSSAARTVTSTASGLSGFSRNWNAPSLTARTASVSWALPLIMMTGVRAASLPHARQRLEAVGSGRHQQVEQDHVGIHLVDLQQRGVAVGRLRDGEALVAKQRAQHPADVGLVVDQEDLARRRSPAAHPDHEGGAAAGRLLDARSCRRASRSSA